MSAATLSMDIPKANVKIQELDVFDNLSDEAVMAQMKNSMEFFKQKSFYDTTWTILLAGFVSAVGAWHNQFLFDVAVYKKVDLFKFMAVQLQLLIPTDFSQKSIMKLMDALMSMKIKEKTPDQLEKEAEQVKYLISK